MLTPFGTFNQKFASLPNDRERYRLHPDNCTKKKGHELCMFVDFSAVQKWAEFLHAYAPCNKQSKLLCCSLNLVYKVFAYMRQGKSFYEIKFKSATSHLTHNVICIVLSIRVQLENLSVKVSLQFVHTSMFKFLHPLHLHKIILHTLYAQYSIHFNQLSSYPIVWDAVIINLSTN